MSRRAAPASLAISLATTLVVGGAGALDAGPMPTGGGPVVRIGPREVSKAELLGRLRELGGVLPAAWGSTSMDALGHLISEVVIPEALLSLAADASDAGAAPPTSYALERALSGATVRALRARVGSPSDVPLGDVRARYDQNRARYNSPERLVLWRILCASAAEAKDVLEAARREGTPKAFTDLAREHSLDKGTYLRGGDLGFVAPDGTTREPGLRVDAAVVRAAQGVKDGEIVPAPVTEGEHFAVVWRRGTVAATHETLDQSAPGIRQLLWNERMREATETLVASLRAQHLTDLNEAPLDGLSR